MRYFRIIPVAGIHHGIIDTVTEVSKSVGMKHGEILRMMGFESNVDLLSYCTNNQLPHFNKSAFVARRLNDICRKLHAPVRVIRPFRERSKHEY